MAERSKFSKESIDFLKSAGSQTSLTWLADHKREHARLLIEPLRDLAFALSKGFSKNPLAKGYRLPRQGFGRLRRPAKRIGRGEPAYRNWVTLKSTTPSKSIFDENPGLYFYLSSDSIVTGGGLYEPSSRQIKKLRAWLADGPVELDRLLKSKAFKAQFPRGLEMDKVLKTFPRFYPQDHKHIERLKLQAFYVNRNFTKKELYSPDFPELLLKNWEQVLRLNQLLLEALNATDDSFVPKESEEELEETENEE